MSTYPLRYEGTRWKIYFGSYEGVEKYAVNELQKIVQRHMPYVVEMAQATDDLPDSEAHAIAVGTVFDNPLIARLVEQGLIEAPQKPEEYTIACMDSPWSEGRRMLVIAGSDANGVLYGAYDFDIQILSKQNQSDLRAAFDTIPDFALREAPAIKNRGIWGWGYVIYDYRRFIDNMAACKMNMLTIWNDHAPLNIRDIIEYAHSRGIKVIFGYHWGWGVPVDPNSPESLEAVKQDVLTKQREGYRGTGADGIYFQLGFTESVVTEYGGKTVGALSCEWVNEIARALLAEEPDLYIQFGLHASSIMDSYVDLEELDPRVTIIWEDAGALPYTYEPMERLPEKDPLEEVLGTVDLTLDYSKKLASLRGAKEFALVPKGWCALGWTDEFEHHAPFIMGERDAGYVRQRLAYRQAHWDYINALWFRFYPHSTRFYREMLECIDGPFTATGLVEDGVFEESIQPSVALFAETLWNPWRSDKELLQRALSGHYTRRFTR